MGVVELWNRTRHAAAALFAPDAEGCMALIPVVKASYAIGGDERLTLAGKPQPVLAGGLPWGEPGQSSWKYEPEAVPPKPTTDVALVGHAWTAKADRTRVWVDFRVGPLRQVARVHGERTWSRRLLVTTHSRPKPFESLPLNYEHAFGGWDRRPKDEKKHRVDPRNPLGRGYHRRGGPVVDGEPLPAIEDPRHPVRGYHDRVPVAGFGFTSPDWHPRVKYAGTYDEKWQSARMPKLPEDFDPRWYQGAHPRLIAREPLRGDEPVLVEGASPRGRLAFRLPGAPAPTCRVVIRHAPDAELETRLDTVIVDTERHEVVLIWRASHPLRDGPHDVELLEVSTSDPAAAVPAEG